MELKPRKTRGVNPVLRLGSDDDGDVTLYADLSDGRSVRLFWLGDISRQFLRNSLSDADRAAIEPYLEFTSDNEVMFN